MLKPDVKEKWLELLRSGEYKQGRRRLKGNTLYCCLGVLCEARHKMTGEEIWRNVINTTDGYLNTNMMNWSGLEECATLVSLNDLKLKNFEEIADYIEENL